MKSSTGSFHQSSSATKCSIDLFHLVSVKYNFSAFVLRRLFGVHIEIRAETRRERAFRWRSFSGDICELNIFKFHAVMLCSAQGNDILFVHHSEPVEVTEAGHKYRVLLHESAWERLDGAGPANRQGRLSRKHLEQIYFGESKLFLLVGVQGAPADGAGGAAARPGEGRPLRPHGDGLHLAAEPRHGPRAGPGHRGGPRRGRGAVPVSAGLQGAELRGLRPGPHQGRPRPLPGPLRAVPVRRQVSLLRPGHRHLPGNVVTGSLNINYCLLFLQNCRDFTAGDHCEDCRAGYVRDGRGGCVPASDTAGGPCTCDPRGSLAPGAPCPEAGGQCECRAGAEGRRCDRCGPGTFGVAGSCAACYCSGVTEECGEAALYWSTLRMPLVSSDHGFTLTDKGLGINKTPLFLAILNMLGMLNELNKRKRNAEL